MHEFHHSKNMGCFASKLSIYDTIFNSEAPYLKWRAKREISFAEKHSTAKKAA
jgi:sterol desaturase/sphingolipid hydroxylase (fatty acid hydroxylase superfamily)